MEKELKRRGVTRRLLWMEYGSDKLFIDVSRGKLPVIDPESGEDTEAEVFVATLRASGMTYASAVYGQKQEDVVKYIERCLLFFGGYLLPLFRIICESLNLTREQ